jgi:transposase InsO family protein
MRWRWRSTHATETTCQTWNITVIGALKYLSIRYSGGLNEAQIVASVGSKGDSYDNALAESFNGLYKTELIHRQGPWRNVEHVRKSDRFSNDLVSNKPGRIQSASGCLYKSGLRRR